MRYFANERHGRRVVVDPDPDPDGPVLEVGRGDDGRPVVRVLEVEFVRAPTAFTPDLFTPLPERLRRYRLHRDTCPARGGT